MKLDWFTVAAQISNFLLLLWLLKRFLYRPILAAMAARQQRIADALATPKPERRPPKPAKDYAARQQELVTHREAELARARDEIAAQRQTWLAQAQVKWMSCRNAGGRNWNGNNGSIGKRCNAGQPAIAGAGPTGAARPGQRRTGSAHGFGSVGATARAGRNPTLAQARGMVARSLPSFHCRISSGR
ncbi:MAG: hypothetical protein U1F70_11865 [Candidatus Competibacteraceae bacterium]